MDECALYGCGEGLSWTREDLDEFRDALEEKLASEDIYITGLYVKKVTGDREAFDISYHAVIGENHYYNDMHQLVTIEEGLAPSVERLIAAYVPKLTEIIRFEAYSLV